MKSTLKALLAAACALALAGPAAAHVSVRIHAAPAPYHYPPVLQVHPRHAPPPGYYVDGYPAWQDQFYLDSRHHQWRRDHWRRHHWHHHGHHHGHHHRHHHRHGWHGR